MSPLAGLFREGTPRRLARGEALFHQGDPVRTMALVTEGRVVLSRPTAEGGLLVLQRAGAGEVLSEASAYAGHYHCAASADTDAAVTLVAVAIFHARLAADPTLAARWAEHLAQAVQGARLRAEVRSIRGVEARLDAWLATGRPIPEKGQIQDLAAEIGVSREALYRALARRR
jgi:CRP/FNR family transcriptional regulator, dissimilatory nitrate respiration regulator